MRKAPRIAQLALAALTGAAVTGGGFALAASASRTIHGCVARRTHQLFVARRCTRQQTALVWNQRGPRGPVGRTGPVGPAGPQAVGAWGLLAENSATAGFNAGQNLSVTRTGVGSVSVSVTAGPCVNQLSSIVVTPDTATFLGSAVPIAYVTGTPGATAFTVHLGTMNAGAFIPQDGTVGAAIAVYCRTP
ncbi:MAG: hypothetical protein ACYC0H_18645 [Solirubrobacteraceae bacterium]